MLRFFCIKKLRIHWDTELVETLFLSARLLDFGIDGGDDIFQIVTQLSDFRNQFIAFIHFTLKQIYYFLNLVHRCINSFF